MKQNDWIVAGVCIVLFLASLIVAITQARTPETPAKPTPVPTNKVEIPAPEVVMQNGLPGTGDANSGSAPSLGGPGGPGAPGGNAGGSGEQAGRSGRPSVSSSSASGR